MAVKVSLEDAVKGTASACLGSPCCSPPYSSSEVVPKQLQNLYPFSWPI